MDLHKNPTESSVFLMRWISLARAEDFGELNPLTKNSAIDRFLPPIEAHKGSKEDNIMKLNLFSMQPISYSVLASLDTDFNLGLTINGHYDMAVIDLPHVLGKGRRPGPEFIVHDFYFDNCTRNLAVYHSQGDLENRKMSLSVLDCGFLKNNTESIIRISMYVSYLQEIITNLGHTFDAMAFNIRHIEQIYRTPFFQYEDLLNEDERYNGLPAFKDILRVARVGEMSNAFHKFLSQQFEIDQISDVHTVISGSSSENK